MGTLSMRGILSSSLALSTFSESGFGFWWGFWSGNDDFSLATNIRLNARIACFADV